MHWIICCLHSKLILVFFVEVKLSTLLKLLACLHFIQDRSLLSLPHEALAVQFRRALASCPSPPMLWSEAHLSLHDMSQISVSLLGIDSELSAISYLLCLSLRCGEISLQICL